VKGREAQGIYTGDGSLVPRRDKSIEMLLPHIGAGWRARRQYERGYTRLEATLCITHTNTRRAGTRRVGARGIREGCQDAFVPGHNAVCLFRRRYAQRPARALMLAHEL
jgi:hypothetical protein